MTKPSFCVLAMVGLLAGCVTPHGVSVREDGAPMAAVPPDSGLLPRPDLSFALSPLDRVRVQILPLPPAPGGAVFAPFDRVQYDFTLRGPDYRVLRGDELTVRFQATPKLESSVTVRPDGKVTLDNGAEVLAAGKTPLEISAEIDQAYRTQMIHPDASVAVSKTNLALAELAGQATVQSDGSIAVPRLGRFLAAGLATSSLADDLSAAASKYYGDALVARVSRLSPASDVGGLMGFDQTITVTSDGLLALPQIGFINVKGKTVAAVQAEIQSAVSTYDSNPSAVVMEIMASDARTVYVDGEVARPGGYPLTSGLTILKAITLAGGAIDTGNLKGVILIHRDAANKVFVYVTNLADFINGGAKDNDLVVAPQDIVVVAKTGIAKVDLWVDQYITRLLPFSRDASYSYARGSYTTSAP